MALPPIYYQDSGEGEGTYVGGTEGECSLSSSSLSLLRVPGHRNASPKMPVLLTYTREGVTDVT